MWLVHTLDVGDGSFGLTLLVGEYDLLSTLAYLRRVSLGHVHATH